MVSCYQYMRLRGYPAEKISILTTYNGQKALLRDVIEQRCARHPAFGRPSKVAALTPHNAFRLKTQWGRQANTRLCSISPSSFKEDLCLFSPSFMIVGPRMTRHEKTLQEKRCGGKTADDMEEKILSLGLEPRCTAGVKKEGGRVFRPMAQTRAEDGGE